MSRSPSGKPVIYQVFTRLFGNTNSTNKPWGTLEENGIGKFADFNDRALRAIKAYGVNHIWYTGVPHHAVINEYDGLSSDHPAVVKGRAGSPYAVKDYYNVNPDLASDPAKRLAEFEELIERSHRHGLKVLIDIVPNHVARNYHSVSAPPEVRDFGADDDTSVTYARDNNFYYLPGEDFQIPDIPPGFEPLGGEFDAQRYPKFVESPAKWTGNGARSAKPDWDDWYETVKINYGIRPDGTKDFPDMPDNAASLSCEEHFRFWQDQDVPDSWVKFRDIALYWQAKGIDGFRFDMAEMVPVEFWSYLNAHIKHQNPAAIVVAEVYQPHLYRDYIHIGKMDYLYDKVDLYDTLKEIVQEKAGCARIDDDQIKLADIEPHLLRFLENHDEQRIASPEFAGSGERGWPAMVVTTLLGQGPTLLYFGQAQGEKADQDLGFGRASRTTIFDYAGVPAHQAWMNNGRFDGGGLTAAQADLDAAYQRLLAFSANEPSLLGNFYSLHAANQGNNGYDERCYSFLRGDAGEWSLVFVNFDFRPHVCDLYIPASVANELKLTAGTTLHEKINADWLQAELTDGKDGGLSVPLRIEGYSALVFKANKA